MPGTHKPSSNTKAHFYLGNYSHGKWPGNWFQKRWYCFVGAENRRKWPRVWNTERGYKGNNPGTLKGQSPPPASHGVTGCGACEQLVSGQEGLRSFSELIISHPKHVKGNANKASQPCAAKTKATPGTDGRSEAIRLLLLLSLLPLTNT